MRVPRSVLWLLLGALLSALALRALPAPWIWILLAWALVSGRMALASRRSAASRAAWVAGAALVGLLCLAETGVTVLEWMRRPAAETTRGERLYELVPHDILGAAPLPDTTRHARKFDGDRLVYDAVYTFDEHGLRRTPPCEGRGLRSVLFFGGSFAFGEGLDDDETLPYLVGLATAGTDCVHNFAVHGYGTHHMLAAIEHGLVDAAVEAPPRHAIYEVLYPAHVVRLAGLNSWGRRGPRYVLGEDGRPHHAGRFDDQDRQHPFRAALWSALRASALAGRSLDRARPLDDQDRRLFVAMVVESRDRLRARAPDLDFHVLAWDYGRSEADAQVFEELDRAGIRVHHVRDILPDFAEHHERYELDEADHHPSALANRLLAHYVTDRILRE